MIKKLIAERRKQKIKQGDMAKMLGMSQAVLSKTEAGKREARFCEMVNYARALGLRVELIEVK